VSSRPLLIHLDDHDSIHSNAGTSGMHCDEDKYCLARDGITPLDPIRISDTPLTTTAVCSLQEWLAVVTIEYYDMIMEMDDDDYDSGNPTTTSTKRRPKLARHSTVAHVRIQVSLLASPFSSAHREICHKLTLPNTNNSHGHSLPSLDDNHMDALRSSHQTPTQPSIVFSSDRRQLACLIPYPRGCHSALVAFPLVRPQDGKPPPPGPKLPSYIASSSSSPRNLPRPLPEARSDPQWLSLPSTAGMELRNNALFWLHNITAICNAATVEAASATDHGRKQKSASALLAGCRDGSILGISFQPLLVAGHLYRPTADRAASVTKSKDREKVESPAITFLSYITTCAESTSAEGEDQVTGKLVALQAGKAIIFQTRMVLSLLINRENPMKQRNHDDSTSTTLHNNLDMDATDLSATETEADGGFATPPRRIHAESFHVIGQTGRRHSLPANSRLIEEEGMSLLDHSLLSPRLDTLSAMGNTGLLMLVEQCAHYPGNFCHAKWIIGSLLALLETPTVTRIKTDNSRDRVAQVIGILKDRPPEVMTELTVTLDDIRGQSHSKFTLDEDEQWLDDDAEYDWNGPKNTGLVGNPSSAMLAGNAGMHYDSHTGCLAISSAKQGTKTIGKKGVAVDPQFQLFVCLWHWKTNVLGFTACSASLLSSGLRCPTGRLLFSKERRTNRRRLVHLHSPGRHREWSRIRKDIYELGVLSSPNEVHNNSGIGVKEASAMLLSSSSVAFAAVVQVRRLRLTNC
jgi:hypothetical protein